MGRISLVLVLSSLFLGGISCRAAFQDLQKQNLVSGGDELGATKDGGKTSNSTADAYETLEVTKELPPEDSESYGCDGTVIIHEKGKDKNRDKVLQPTEVTDITTECKAKDKNPPGGGKGPDGKGPDGKPLPTKCPNQSKDPNDKCDTDPSQSGKK